jgi:hypothetical protein
MCHSGVGSILVMFDVLDCYILYMCLLLFTYFISYTYFGGSPTGEVDKIGKKTFKKILMFVREHGTRVDIGLRGIMFIRLHSSVMFVGYPMNISYVRQI